MRGQLAATTASYDRIRREPATAPAERRGLQGAVGATVAAAAQGRVAGGARWTWTSLRSNPVCGFSTGSVMNLPLTLAVYATLCKKLKLPFRRALPTPPPSPPPSLLSCPWPRCVDILNEIKYN